MSYILDALRKADAQRDRDPARGIHAQAHRPIGTSVERHGARNPVFWGAAVAAFVTLAAAGWYLYAGRNAPVTSRADRAAIAAGPATGSGVPAPVPAAAAPAPVVGVAPVPAPAVPAVATRIEPPAPAIRQVQMPERDPRATSQPPMRGMPQGTLGAAPQPAANPAPPPPAAASAAPAGVPAPAAAPANGASGTTPPAAAVNAPTRAPASPPAAAPAATAPAAAPVAGLPPDAPKLAISGGVYSNNRAQRMLIVNGQVFNEGSEIGPGVVLEEIKAKTALLRFRGARYTVSY